MMDAPVFIPDAPEAPHFIPDAAPAPATNSASQAGPSSVSVREAAGNAWNQTNTILGKTLDYATDPTKALRDFSESAVGSVTGSDAYKRLSHDNREPTGPAYRGPVENLPRDTSGTPTSAGADEDHAAMVADALAHRMIGAKTILSGVNASGNSPTENAPGKINVSRAETTLDRYGNVVSPQLEAAHNLVKDRPFGYHSLTPAEKQQFKTLIGLAQSAQQTQTIQEQKNLQAEPDASITKTALQTGATSALNNLRSFVPGIGTSPDPNVARVHEALIQQDADTNPVTATASANVGGFADPVFLALGSIGGRVLGPLIGKAPTLRAALAEPGMAAKVGAMIEAGAKHYGHMYPPAFALAISRQVADGKPLDLGAAHNEADEMGRMAAVLSPALEGVGMAAGAVAGIPRAIARGVEGARLEPPQAEIRAASRTSAPIPDASTEFHNPEVNRIEASGAEHAPYPVVQPKDPPAFIPDKMEQALPPMGSAELTAPTDGKGRVEQALPPTGPAEVVAETEGQTGTSSNAAETPLPKAVGAAGINSPEFSHTAAEQDTTSTSIKNAYSAEERKRLGVEERPTVERRSFDEVVSDATKAEKSNPNATEELLNKLRSIPNTAINDTEVGLLTKHIVKLTLDRDKYFKAVGEAYGRGDTAAEEMAKANYAAKNAQIFADRKLFEDAGTSSARGLGARRMVMAMDYSLESMTQRLEAAKGKPLTAEEHKAIESDFAESEAKRVITDEAESNARDAAANDAADVEIGTLKMEAKSADSLPHVKSLAQRIVSHLDKLSDAAEVRIRARGIKVNALGDVANLADMSIVGAAQISKGFIEKGAWGIQMVKKFGEEIKPHLDTLWDESNKATDRIVEKLAGPKLHQSVKEVIKPIPKDMLGKIKLRAEEGAIPSDLRPYIKALALEKVRAGIDTREPLIDALHADIKNIFPPITREEVRNLMSGYGDFKPLDKEPAKVALRNINQQSQKLAQLEDLNKGNPPKATGVERQSPNTETQALTKEVNAKKKELGIQTTDPAKQLKSTLDGMKTRAKNAINILQMEIDTGKRIVAGKGVKISDAELEVLRKQLTEVRAAHEAAFGKKGLTDEQRLNLATRAAETNLKSWAERLDKARRGVFDTPAKNTRATNKEIEALRAQADAARQEVNELKAAANPIQSRSETQARALEKRIAEIEGKLEAGDSSTKGAKQGPDTAYISDLKAKLKTATGVLSKLRESDPELRAKREVETAETAIAELQRKSETGEFVDKSTKAEPTPEGAMAQERLKAAREAYDTLRDADPNYIAAKNAASNEAYRTALARRKADLLARDAAGDFEPRSRPERKSPLDHKSLSAQADYERIKQKFDNKVEKARLAARPRWVKTLDFIGKWSRLSALSSPITLLKLASAAAEQVAFKPLDEMAGGVLNKIPGISKIAARAPSEGAGLNVKEYAKSIREAFTQGMADAYKTLTDKTHKSDLEIKYGKGGIPPTALEFFGVLHGAEKAPLKRFAFNYAFEKRIAWAIRERLDPTDVTVQQRAGIDAFKDTERMLFQEDNRVVRGYQAALAQLESKDDAGNQSPLGVAGASVARSVLPVVKIGTNIVAQTFERVAGGLWGAGEVANTWRKGFDSLTPEKADQIMRHLKRGSVGSAALLLGYLAPEMFGGYYQKGENRDDEDAGEGAAKIGGINISKTFLHNPLLEAAQVGATARRVQDSIHKGESRGVIEGIGAGALGLLEQVPFARSAEDLTKLFDPAQRESGLARLSQSLVPQAVQYTARQLDKNTPFSPFESPTVRRPKGVIEGIEAGIPGLRQQVGGLSEKQLQDKKSKGPKEKAIEMFRKGNVADSIASIRALNLNEGEKSRLIQAVRTEGGYADHDTYLLSRSNAQDALSVLEKNPKRADSTALSAKGSSKTQRDLVRDKIVNLRDAAEKAALLLRLGAIHS